MSTTKKYIEGFTRQLSDALKRGQSLDLVRPGSDIRNVVIAGMGGSGIGANLVESLTFEPDHIRYRRQSWARKFSSSSQHTIRIVVVSGRVDVDAFAVLK